MCDSVVGALVVDVVSGAKVIGTFCMIHAFVLIKLGQGLQQK